MVALFLSLAASLPVAVPDSVNPSPIDSITSQIEEAELLRAQYRSMMEQKNQPGSIASDFSFITRKGKELTLHSVEGDKNILLIFYDPDCDDCHNAIKTLETYPGKLPFNIVAIDAEEDKERWMQTASQLPSDWTVGFAISPIQEDEIYYLLTMPTIYLLDKNKTVLQRDTTIEEAFSHQ